jgi:hypothetical protein
MPLYILQKRRRRRRRRKVPKEELSIFRRPATIEIKW